MDDLAYDAELFTEPVTSRAREAVIGTLHSFDDVGTALVDFPGNPSKEPVPALSATILSAGEIGRAVVLLFANEELSQPIVIGLLRPPVPEASATSRKRLRVELDGETVVLSANRELVLRCGEASITLTKAGKVILRGKYVVSRSSGVNRIKGGSVQIN